VEELRKECREREGKWNEEREKLVSCIKGLERKVEELQRNREGRGKGGRVLGEGGGEMGDKVKELEKRLEKKEREERRKNVIIKGLKVKEGNRREAVEEVLNVLEVRGNIEEVKRVGGDREQDREMVLVRLKIEEQRGEIMKRKRELKGRKERIMEDWTWKERKMRWRLEEIARKEKGKKGENRIWKVMDR